MADDARIDARTGTEVIRLWPDGASRIIEGVGPEATFRAPGGNGPDTTMLRNVTDSTITVYRPAAGKANGVGVIVAPGGGWRILAWHTTLPSPRCQTRVVRPHRLQPASSRGGRCR